MTPVRVAAGLLGVVAALLALLLLWDQAEEEDYPGEQQTAVQAKTLILPEGAPQPIAPYSPAIRAGDFVFVAGQIGIDPATGEMVEGGIVAETRQVMANLQTLLNAAGLDFDDAVRATVYLADLNDYGTFNEEYGAVIGDVPPSRVAIQVARLPLDARVEVSMIAYGPTG